jgi:hypothetical protein
MRKVLAVLAISTAMATPAQANGATEVVYGTLFGIALGAWLATPPADARYPQGQPPVYVGNQPQVAHNQYRVQPRCFQPIFDRYTGQYQRSVPVPCY